MVEQERERWDDQEAEQELAHEEEAIERCYTGMMLGRACVCRYHEGSEPPSVALVRAVVDVRAAEVEDAQRVLEEARAKLRVVERRWWNAQAALEAREAGRDEFLYQWCSESGLRHIGPCPFCAAMGEARGALERAHIMALHAPRNNAHFQGSQGLTILARMLLFVQPIGVDARGVRRLLRERTPSASSGLRRVVE